MQQAKRLTLNGLTTPHMLFLIISLGMIAVSIYLTNHYYETYFPKNLGSGDSLCELSSFWGCAKASTSALGSIFHVPTSLFGIIVGLIGVAGSIFASEESEKFSKFIYFANAAGCVVLLLFSLIALKGLCPFCTVYYILSFAAAFLFYKFSNAHAFPELKHSVTYLLLTLVPSVLMYNYFVDTMKKQDSLSIQYVAQYKTLATPGDPAIESPYKIHMATEKFSDAALRISIFSDFECPFCKVVSDQMKPLIAAFPKQLNIQYMFYPLDNNCNPNVKSAFHQFACKAAYLAACDKKRFHSIHDIIFERQEELSFENLNKWEKELGLSNCFNNKEVQDVVQQTINAAEQFALKSTPTIIINGKKIEGTIPTVHLKAILKNILNETK